MKKKIAFMLKHSTKKNIANSRLALPLQSTVLSFPYIISFKLQETPPLLKPHFTNGENGVLKGCYYLTVGL